MSQEYVMNIAPKIGSRVLGTLGDPESGKREYQRQLDAMVATGGGNIGSRINGPLKPRDVAGPRINPAEVAPEPDATPLPQLDVPSALSRIRQPGADLAQLWTEEHTRQNGPRKTVVAALREAGYQD
jgi:hypothetical protein